MARFLSFVIIAIFFMFAVSTRAAADNVFYSLVQAAQQWQDANPNQCGQDTQACGVQKMLLQFQTCSAFRVVNGCPIGDQTVYGWQVGVVLGGSLCSGTLVSPTHVVCAAHCVQHLSDGDTSRIRVYIGPKNLRQAQSVQKHGVSRFAANPAYDANKIVNDASILELSSPVQFDQNGIRPACLPTGPVQRPLSSLVVGGYGIDDYNNKTGAGTLRYTVIATASDTLCSALYGADQYNSTSTFCAIGQRASFNTDSCNGDSGSAVMSKSASGQWRLVGIVSYGTAKCSTAPGVYSDAYNCGIRASAAAIRRATLQDKKFSDLCDARKVIAASRAPPKRRPTPINHHHQQQQPHKTGRKLGGIASSMSETIRVHSCTRAVECESNVCREIEACHTLRDGGEHVQARDEQEEREEDEHFRSSAFTSFIQRPMKPVNEAVAVVELPALFRRECKKLNVCWLPAWVDAYSTTPVFDFDTIGVDENEDGSANRKNKHKTHHA